MNGVKENVSVEKHDDVERKKNEMNEETGVHKRKREEENVLEVKKSVSMDDVWRSIQNSGGGSSSGGGGGGHEMKKEEVVPILQTSGGGAGGGVERAETFTKPANFHLYTNQMQFVLDDQKKDVGTSEMEIPQGGEVQRLSTIREEDEGEKKNQSVRACLPSGMENNITKKQVQHLLPLQQPPTPHIPQPLRPGTMTAALLYDSANISGKIARLQTLPPLYNSQSFEMLMTQQQQQHALNVGTIFRECSTRVGTPAVMAAPTAKLQQQQQQQQLQQEQYGGATAAAGSTMNNNISSMKAPAPADQGGGAAWYPREGDPRAIDPEREENEAMMKQAKNRESARRSRQKRQNYTIALEKQVEELTQLNHQMKLKIGEEMIARARKPTRTTLLDRRRRTSSF